MISNHGNPTIIKVLFWLSTIMLTQNIFAQKEVAVNWINFEQLNDSLQSHPKKVFVMFYADWCSHCRKMDRVAFLDEDVIGILNKDYYAVRMDIESADSILFGNQWFVNENINKRKSIHQIPLLMASRKDHPFSVPAIVLLDEYFEAKARYFQYLNTSQMLEIISLSLGAKTHKQKR